MISEHKMIQKKIHEQKTCGNNDLPKICAQKKLDEVHKNLREIVQDVADNCKWENTVLTNWIWMKN